jgi:hypothetical protein
MRGGRRVGLRTFEKTWDLSKGSEYRQLKQDFGIFHSKGSILVVDGRFGAGGTESFKCPTISGGRLLNASSEPGRRPGSEWQESDLWTIETHDRGSKGRQ